MLESPERGKPERPERSSDWEDLRGLMTCVELGPEFKEAKVRFSLQCSLGVGSEANHRAFDSVRKKESNVGNREVKPERKGRVRLGRTLSSRTRAFRCVEENETSSKVSWGWGWGEEEREVFSQRAALLEYRAGAFYQMQLKMLNALG